MQNKLTTCGLFSILAALSGCAPGQNSQSSSFQIKLVDAPASAASLLSSSFKNLSSGLRIDSNPTSISDFTCFAANITGDGITPNGGLGIGCTVDASFKGPGYITQPTIRGNAINADIPAGSGRTIDIYGIYPPDQQHCNGTAGQGSGGGYFVGSKTADVLANASVTIPITYTAGTNPDVTCTGGSGGPVVTLAASNGTQQIASGVNCSASYPNPTNTAPAAAGLGGPTSVPNNGYMTQDGTPTFSECTSMATGDNQLAQYQFSTAGVSNIAQFGMLTVTWIGQADIYSSPCGSSLTDYSSTGGGTVWIWNNSTTTWQQVGGGNTSGSTSLQTITFQFPTPSLYPDANNLIYIEVVGPHAPSGTSCSSIATDFVGITLQ